MHHGAHRRSTAAAAGLVNFNQRASAPALISARAVTERERERSEESYRHGEIEDASAKGSRGRERREQEASDLHARINRGALHSSAH